MYAVVLNDTVIAPLAGTEEQIEKFKLEYPECILVECTEENSPIILGSNIKDVL